MARPMTTDEARVETGRLSIRLVHDPIDVAEAAAFLADPRAGGLDLFIGTTRRWTGDAETLELSYECYAPMAMKEMRRLVEEAMTRWPLVRACIRHRLGTVPVAEASVLIGVAAPHRADAFEACRFLIDRLKRQVPIWKRETYADGRLEWVQGERPPDLPNPEETS
ncbi:molybdenum cofactor biosynthesis protein MoaE [Rhodocaloribacter sp.]